MVDPKFMNLPTTRWQHIRKLVLRICPAFVRISLLLLFLSLPLQALRAHIERPVALDPQKALIQYTNQVWETGKTPLEGAIRAIHQSRDGYIWMGTLEGLYNFDGERFAVFNSLCGWRSTNRHADRSGLMSLIRALGFRAISSR
mgnify:CR=1 FL=1